MSVKCLSAILGPEMGAPILRAPGKTRQEKPMPIGGGGSADVIFMGARIWLKLDMLDVDTNCPRRDWSPCREIGVAIPHVALRFSEYCELSLLYPFLTVPQQG